MAAAASHKPRTRRAPPCVQPAPLRRASDPPSVPARPTRPCPWPQPHLAAHAHAPLAAVGALSGGAGWRRRRAVQRRLQALARSQLRRQGARAWHVQCERCNRRVPLPRTSLPGLACEQLPTLSSTHTRTSLAGPPWRCSSRHSRPRSLLHTSARLARVAATYTAKSSSACARPPCTASKDQCSRWRSRWPYGACSGDVV
jgi:hypothetical protein